MGVTPHSEPSGNPRGDRGLIDAARRQAEDVLRRASAGRPGTSNEAPPPDTDPSTAIPISISGYELIREIHRGGQGVVYQGIQKSTRRRVAIKIMREGPFGGRADRNRFEREVQILGQLQHPNIVTIHESGTAEGHFYFVMDYISGQPLDAFLAAGKCPIDDTLRPFVKICDAVHAAHLRGVIHRDLKPSNIRVNAAGEPHILDFGLAKVSTELSSDDRATPVMTLTGQFIGSLPWSSPEQAEGHQGKIDVRTDVYALGVILYHMLTGRFPYAVVGSMRDVLDNILKAEPRRPGALRRQINNEVETIVLKCLQKERERRYQSAGELARDIRHYLAGEPIEAKRDSTWYVLRKTLRRHRAAALTTAGVLVLGTGAGIAMSVLYFKARTEAQKAERINTFLQTMLASADPFEEKGPNVTVREVLDAASQTIEDELIDEPEVEAAARATLGKTYAGLSLYEKAEPHLRAALTLRRKTFGPRNVHVAASLHDLGAFLRAKGDYAAAEQTLREGLAMRRDLLGGRHIDVAETLSELGSVLHDKGDYDAAESMLGEALDLRRALRGEDDVLVAGDLNNLGLCKLDKGDHEAAIPMFRQAIAVHRKRLGKLHPRVASELSNLGMVLYTQGNFVEAESLFREALDLDRKRFGDEHLEIATDLNNLAVLFFAQGNYKTAESFARETLAVRRRLLGDDHADVAQAFGNLANILQALGDNEAAEPLFRQALDTYSNQFSGEHPAVAATMNNLARLLYEKGDLAAAEPLCRGALAMRRRLLGDEDPQVAMSLNDLANLLMLKGALSEAEPLHQEALALRRKVQGNEHPHVAQSLHDLAGLRHRQGNGAEAELLYRQALAIRRSKLPAQHPEIAATLTGLGIVLVDKGQAADAEPMVREALDIRRRAFPEADWRAACTASVLGACRSAQGRYAEAEPLLSESFSQIRAARGPKAEETLEALHRLIRHYERLGRPDKAEEHRDLLHASDE